MNKKEEKDHCCAEVDAERQEAQQDKDNSIEKLHKSILVGKGRQVTAAADLEELLRKISDLLSNI